MKVYNVVWSIANNSLGVLSSYNPIKENNKTFATKEKAEELYKKLLDAKMLLGVDVNIQIKELELE